MRATPVAVVAANVGRESSFIGFRSIDSAFPFNFQQVIPMAHTLAELQELLARNPGSYVLTNERDAGLDKDRRFELIIAQPSPIEHHTTRVFRYAESSESKDPK
jgi:hypothetical protein